MLDLILKAKRFFDSHLRGFFWFASFVPFVSWYLETGKAKDWPILLVMAPVLLMHAFDVLERLIWALLTLSFIGMSDREGDKGFAERYKQERKVIEEIRTLVMEEGHTLHSALDEMMTRVLKEREAMLENHYEEILSRAPMMPLS